MMAFIRRRTAACAAFALSVSVSGAAGGETLRDAMALAYASNPTLQAERANVRALDEGYVQARSAALPLVTGTITSTATDSDTTVSGLSSVVPGLPPTAFSNTVDQTRGQNQAAVRVAQNLYRGGQVRAGIDAALSSIESGRANLHAVEQQVLLDAATAYLDVYRDGEVVAIRLNNVEVLAQQLQAARDRFEVGEITRTDVAQAEARLAGARSLLTAAQAQLTASRSNYERVVGQQPGQLETQAALPPVPDSFDEALSAGLARNPSVGAARFAEETARANVRSARGTLRPSVTANAAAEVFDEYFDAGTDGESYTVGVQVSVPLFSGNLNSSRLRQALANQSQARLRLREAERFVNNSVSTAWAGFEAARSVIVSSREQVRANEIAFEGVEEEARVGLRTTLDVLDAEQELLNSRLTLVSAERDAQVAAFGILQAVGSLTAAELALTDDVYDPGVNLSDIRGHYLGLGIIE